MGKTKDLGHLAHIVAYDAENHITVPAGITMHTNQLVASQAWVTTALGSYALSSSLSSYVPTSRTITINGTTFDLSANREWTISGTDSTKLPLAGGTLTGALNGTSALFTGNLRTDTGLGLKYGSFVSTSGYLNLFSAIVGSTMTLNLKDGTGGFEIALNFSASANRNYTFPSANGTIALTSDIPSLSGYVPTSRTLTINGTAFDLSADRAWTISAGTTLNGTGFVKASGTTITYDNSTYLTGITSALVTGALGFTPYNATNPSGYITSAGSITGSSGSVSGLTLNNSSTGINPNDVTQNQLGYDVSVSLFGQTDGGLYSSAYSSSWIHQIHGDFRSGQIAIRGKNSGTWQAWRTVLDSSNYSSYALPLSGGTMSGTITLKNISGVAQTVPNTYGAYLHLGDWAVARTAAGAVLVNTAYRADYATDLFDMNISRFTNNSGYITSSGKADGSLKFWATTHPNDYYLVNNWTGAHWYITSNHPSPVRVGYADNSGTVGGYSVDVAGSANTIPTRNASGYLIPQNWIQLNGIYGLYSPTNGAHFYPNDRSYGSWKVLGDRNGWRGLHFGEGTGITLMMNEGEFGFHRESVGWVARFTSGHFHGYANSAGSISGQANSATINATSGNAGNNIVLRDGNGDIAIGTLNTNHAYFGGGGRGLTSADSYGSYGNVHTYGTGQNGYSGYGAYDNAGYRSFFMWNSGNGGIYMQDRGKWELYYFGGNDCTAITGSETYDWVRVCSNGKHRITNDSWCDATSWAYTFSNISDGRLKENIITVDSALDKVLQLRGVYYNWIIDTENKKHIGLIAQETAAVCPEVVNYHDETDTYSVNYSELSGLFVESTKELNQKLMDANARIELLETKLNQLLNA